MGKQPAITENSKHELAKKLFITDKNRTHRKAKKAFYTVNGVHKLVYSSGVTWNKYNCNITTYVEDIYAQVTPSGEMKTFTVWFLDAYYEYVFHDWEGFSGGLSNANEHIDTVEKANSIDLIGMYHIYDTQVWEIVSVDEVKDGGSRPLSLKFTAKLVAECEVASTEERKEYSQGSTSYGTVEADEGALPENGALVEGSVTDGYCVLEIGGTYYYYVLTE